MNLAFMSVINLLFLTYTRKKLNLVSCQDFNNILRVYNDYNEYITHKQTHSNLHLTSGGNAKPQKIDAGVGGPTVSTGLYISPSGITK